MPTTVLTKSTKKILTQPLSVGMVADICGVCNKTILNWIYGRGLRSFRTAGGKHKKHHRILPIELKKFLARNKIPINFECSDEREVRFLIVQKSGFLRNGYVEKLSGMISEKFQHAKVIVSDDVFQALVLIGETRPQFIIADFSLTNGVHTRRFIEVLRSRELTIIEWANSYSNALPVVDDVMILGKEEETLQRLADRNAVNS